MQHTLWLLGVVKDLQEAGFRHVSGAPLLTSSQYDTVSTLAYFDVSRILQVSVVTDADITHIQVWWHKNDTIDIHVAVFGHDIVFAPNGALAMTTHGFKAVDHDRAHEIIMELALGLRLQTPTEQYAH